LLVDNINDILKTDVDTWSPYYQFFTQSTSTNKELLFLVTDNNNIILHDIDNSIPFHTDFMYLEMDDIDYGDIKTIEKKVW